MRRYLKAGLIVLILVTLLVSPVQAQDVLARIDQAMEHLSQQLGLSYTITRSTDYWQWVEEAYPDSGLGCPAPGFTYAPTPNRGYRITITHEGVDYEYRASLDGSILVRCDSGFPLYRSDTGVAPVEPLEAVPLGDTVVLPDKGWYAWIYMDGSDLLYLINEDGAQVTVKRPSLTGEPMGSVPGANNVKIAISRDGRYLLEAVRLPSGNWGLGLYDFMTGALTTIQEAQPNEEISLGWGKGGWPAGSTLIFDASSGKVAVAFGVQDDPMHSEWRIAIIDLATAAIEIQIDNIDLAFIMDASEAALLTTLGSGAWMPRPVYYDNGNGVHIQMIRLFTGGSPSYPAFVWYPNSNIARSSPYVYTDIDILPTNGAAVYSIHDGTIPALPPDGPFDSHNAIAQGFPTAISLTLQTMYTNGTMFHFRPQWAGFGDMIAFENGASSLNTNWALYDLNASLEPAIQLPQVYTAVHGVSDGLLAVSEAAEGFNITLIEDAATRTVIWTAPPMNGNPVLAWVQPIGVDFGLGTIALNEWAYLPGESGVVVQPTLPPPPPPPGTIHCPGTPASNMSNGMEGRVTFSTGTPLNMRQTPSTAAAVVRILPEGATFDVVGGPQCADGYTWWQIRIPGNTYGWAAEGDSEGYFIEPMP